MRSRSKRQTHSDRPSEDEAQGARSVPDVQRMKRSTPAARPVSNDGGDRLPSAGPVSSDGSDPLQAPDGCPAGEGPTSNSNRRTGPRTKDQRQLRRFDPRCLQRTNVNSASAAIPSWSTWGERIILRSYPCNRDHAPRVSMVGNLGKSLTMQSLSRPRDPQKRACGAPFQNRRQIVHKT